MKIKNIVFIIFAMALTSCSEKTEYEATVPGTETEITTTTETETTETTTITTTEAVNTYEDVIIDEADKEWFECYNDMLTERIFYDSQHGAELIYFDDDEIPELVTFFAVSATIYKFDAESKIAKIFADSYIGNFTNHSGVYYRPKKNMFSITSRTGAGRTIRVYQYNSLSKDDYTEYIISEANYLYPDANPVSRNDFDHAEELNINLPDKELRHWLFYGDEWKRIELENKTSFNITNENKSYAMKAMYKTLKEQDIS